MIMLWIAVAFFTASVTFEVVKFVKKKSVSQDIKLARHHIKTLLRQHNISATVRRSEMGVYSAYKNYRTVSIPPVETMKDYIVSLHEIGHILCGHHKQEATNKITKQTLKHETDAWKKAKELSLFGWDADCLKEQQRCLESYVSGFARQTDDAFDKYNKRRDKMTEYVQSQLSREAQ